MIEKNFGICTHYDQAEISLANLSFLLLSEAFICLDNMIDWMWGIYRWRGFHDSIQVFQSY